MFWHLNCLHFSIAIRIQLNLDKCSVLSEHVDMLNSCSAVRLSDITVGYYVIQDNP